MRLIGLGLLLLYIATIPSITPDDYPKQWEGCGEGETHVLYRRYNVTAMSQGQVGSCVGAATSKALELMHGVKFSTEWCYAISRHHFDQDSKYGGSFCVWAAQSMRDVGAIPAQDYAILGIDLSKYSDKVARAWQPRGPPESLIYVANNYKASGYVKISTWEQLRDAIANRIPVIVGSNVGFGSRGGAVRDKTGMLKARWWSKWPHALLFCGVSDGKSQRVLVLNSWGNKWVRGPKWLGDEPEGSFWISREDCEKMLEADDCWAILPIPGL